jgi:hypothetical protein
MQRARIRMALRTCAAVLVAFGATFFVCDRVWAGGVTFDSPDDSEADAGPPFSGYVKDRDGNPVDDAKITVTVKIFNSTLILRTDSDGHFLVKGFDKSVDPADVDISCSKDGYEEYAKSRRPASSDPTAAIQIDCILQKL